MILTVDVSNSIVIQVHLGDTLFIKKRDNGTLKTNGIISELRTVDDISISINEKLGEVPFNISSTVCILDLVLQVVPQGMWVFAAVWDGDSWFGAVFLGYNAFAIQ